MRGTPGFEIHPGYESVSHRGYHNCILTFDECRLPDAQVLGEAHRGFDLANSWLYGTRLTVAAMCVGRARRAFDLAVAQAAERRQFGQPIGRFQGVSFKLADMITAIDAADWLTLAAAWRLDRGLAANREIASAKLYATEMLARVTDEAVQVFGGMGLMSDLPLARFWRDAREDYTVGQQRGRSRLLAPGVDWTRMVADDTLRPNVGHRVNFSLRGASDSLGSDTSFVQAAVSAKWIRSLPNSGRILVRGELGAVWEDDFNALPPSVRFFAGGDTSVRGYEFATLGPVDAHGQVVGGTRLAVASFEYEYPVRPRWSVAAFVDTGNAFRATEFETRTGAGAGLRWQSPPGPIRADVAKPLDGHDRNPRVHIGLGPDL